MDLVGRFAEALARGTSRRESIKTIAAGTFGLAAAWATQGPVGAGPLSRQCGYVSSQDACHPSNGRLCTDPEWGWSKKNCKGSKCANNCTIDTEDWPQPNHTGCWCTAVTGKGKHRSYYKCCDCLCPASSGEMLGCSCNTQVFVKK